tara:strand:- start:1960 stop:2463 length:504 start_codon:yes stop_codon:yes gene_type:complete
MAIFGGMMTLANLSRRAATSAVLALMIWSVSFFLHFFWEMAQVPFFSGMAEARHWDVVWLCTRATVGDANIAFGAYVLAALFVKDWLWIAKPWRLSTLSIYLGVGLTVTILFEYWATGAGQRWNYSGLMPDVPLLSIGALPLVQWVVIPILLIYTVKWMFLGWQISN